MNTPTRSARRIAYQLVLLQAIVFTAISIVWWTIGEVRDAYSVMLGGIAVVIPSFLYAQCLFRTTSPQAVKRIVMTMFIGEFIKLGLSALLVVLIIWLLPVKLLPVVIGFIGAHFGFWLSPIIIKMNKEQVLDERRSQNNAS